MGFLDALFGGGKEEKAPRPVPQKSAPATPAPTAVQKEATGVSPAVVAAIAAAVYAMTGTSNLAIRIRHDSNTWVITGRQQLMDSRQFA